MLLGLSFQHVRDVRRFAWPQGLRTIHTSDSAIYSFVTCFVLRDVPTPNLLTQGNASCLDLTVIDRKGCQRKPCNQRQGRCFYLDCSCQWDQKEVDMCADDSETEDLFQFVGVRIVPKTRTLVWFKF